MVDVKETKRSAKVVSCDGKQQHKTAEKADKHRINMIRQGKKGYHVYKCNFCGKFHVGREGKKK